MTNFKITITSDNVCPWCYVGKKKLEAGIAAYQSAHPNSGDTFTTTWKPFYLDPSTPVPGVDKQNFYEQKFGSGERVRGMQSRLAGIGEDVGIKFKFGGLIGGTRDSHRLLALAGTKGPETQTGVVEQLFRGYFEEEQDVASKEFLKGAGVSGGLKEEEVVGLLESDLLGEQVDREVKEAQAAMITGVPNFVIQDKYELQGAQDAAGFKRIFEKLKEVEA